MKQKDQQLPRYHYSIRILEWLVVLLVLLLYEVLFLLILPCSSRKLLFRYYYGSFIGGSHGHSQSSRHRHGTVALSTLKEQEAGQTP